MQASCRGYYARTYDPFVALTAAAAATVRLRIGTAICLVIERDPIITAKEVASIDQLSGGRFLFGVGAGWNREEMSNHGTDPSTRFGRMRESIEAMKAIWASDEASYHGKQVDFDAIWCWPKPAQKPHPPVLVGGNGVRVLDRVLAFGDGWMPNRVEEAKIMPRLEELARLAADAGREPIPVTITGMKRDAPATERYERAGVRRVVYWLPAAGADEVESAMDEYAAAAEEYRAAGS